MAVVSKLNNLLELAKEKSSDRRRALLREVTDMFFEEPPTQGSDASQSFDDVLTKLAEQAALEAREELSKRFAGAQLAPRGLIMKLAQDAIEVAAPILAQSNVLTEEDLVDLAESASQTHLKAISRRDRVSERLSDTIVRRGDDETVAELVSNDGAQFSRQTIESVTERAETSVTLQGPLIEREDTPTDLLNDLMLSVENHLRERILERFDSVDPAELEKAMAQSHARLSERMEEDKHLEAANKFVDGLKVRKQLDGPVLARLLREGERMKFYVAFADLTGVDYMAAKRAVEQECIDPLALICRSAGFDKALFVTLAVLRNTSNEDAFKDAKHLGHLYDQIDPADADRAMRFWRMRRDMAA